MSKNIVNLNIRLLVNYFPNGVNIQNKVFKSIQNRKKKKKRKKKNNNNKKEKKKKKATSYSFPNVEISDFFLL